MAEIVSLEEERKARSPHLVGAAICIGCKHKWEAVAPIGTIDLECPSCSLPKGAFIALVADPHAHWHCNCGNDLFRLTEHRLYCAACGVTQEF